MKINVNSMARKVEVDNRIPILYYYRIADNLLRQASVYREENNLVDLYIMLLRFSSLVSETIPDHRDYQILLKERSKYRKKLKTVIEELESLKPEVEEVERRMNELNIAHARAHPPQLAGPDTTSYTFETCSLERPTVTKDFSSITSKEHTSMCQLSSGQCSNNHSWVSSNSLHIDKHFQNLSIKRPLPNRDTLSRHSFLGPNGLRGQWRGPSAEIKVQYPSSIDYSPSEIPSESSSLNQAGQYDLVAVKDYNVGGTQPTMDSVLSLDDGRWNNAAQDPHPLLINEAKEDLFQLSNIHQPSPPPVLAKVQNNFAPIPPSKVADPRPGPVKTSPDGMPSSTSYQHLHISVRMMEDFLRLAQANTRKNLETCGVLAGSLKNRVFQISTLIIPKQESTSDSCQTLNEEEIFEVQDRLSLFPLGWIHTHPTQTCFMSSVDLHTHYSYQIMLPEAIAIVMAPTDTSSCLRQKNGIDGFVIIYVACGLERPDKISSLKIIISKLALKKQENPHGIFHLSDPGGVSVIRNCQQRGFHPHEEPEDGSPIYEHCSHVFMNPNIKFHVVDLR